QFDVRRRPRRGKSKSSGVHPAPASRRTVSAQSFPRRSSHDDRDRGSAGCGSAGYSVITLHSLGGSASGANSIDDAGWISGLSTLPGDQVVHAALWVHGQAVDLGALGGPAANSGVAWPNHASRAVVGISETSGVDPLGETWSCAAFIPTTGHTCVGFVWRDGAMSPLPTLGGNNGYAAGANRQGQVVGWAETAV